MQSAALMYASVHCYYRTMYGTVHKAEIEADFAGQVDLADSFAAFDMVVVTASAGGIPALISFLRALPGCFPAPIVVAQHLASRTVYSSRLERVLQNQTKLRVKWLEEREIALAGTVYLTPQDRIALFERQDQSIVTVSKANAVRGTLSGNSLFQSAASVFEDRVLGIILSGALSDGADGAAEIARFGGRILAQSYGTCDFSDMPRAAMMRSRVGLAFDPVGLAQAAVTLVMVPGASDWFRVGTLRSLAMQS
jgi:two-component system, chemotaxis family, protein-glutamate methylesterase/glutaminase